MVLCADLRCMSQGGCLAHALQVLGHHMVPRAALLFAASHVLAVPRVGHPDCCLQGLLLDGMVREPLTQALNDVE